MTSLSPIVRLTLKSSITKWLTLTTENRRYCLTMFSHLMSSVAMYCFQWIFNSQANRALDKALIQEYLNVI